MAQSMQISSQTKHFAASHHWSSFACKHLKQTKSEAMFDLAEWETRFLEGYRKVNIAIKAYSVYSTQSTLPNDAGLEQFLKYVVNFMFGRCAEKKSGSLVYLFTRPATGQKILHMSENLIAAERSLKFQQHVLAENEDAVAVITVIYDWVSQFFFRFSDLVHILKTFISADGQLLTEQTKYNADWLFSCEWPPLIWQKCSKLCDLCLETVSKSVNPSMMNLNSQTPDKECNDSAFFSHSRIHLQNCLVNACNAIIDMLDRTGKKFLTDCCVENKLLPMAKHMIDCDLCKVSYPETFETCPLIQLGSFLVIFGTQKNVELRLLTVIDSKRIQKLRCSSEHETNDTDFLLEILSLNEHDQLSMICLNFRSLFRRSCWIANLQQVGEIQPDISEEITSSSRGESQMAQALEKYTAQSIKAEHLWGIDAEAHNQRMQGLDAILLIQESRKAESELAQIISQSTQKTRDPSHPTSIGTELIMGTDEKEASTRNNQSIRHAISTASPSKITASQQDFTSAAPSRSIAFIDSLNKPQPNVDKRAISASEIILAREEAKLTDMQRAIETGISAIPSLRQGDLLIKFNKRSSKNVERYVMLMDKTFMIVWGSIEKLTSNLNLREVLGISLGMGSSTLRRAYCAENHHSLPKLTNGTQDVTLCLDSNDFSSFLVHRTKCTCIEFGVFATLRKP
jgi:hypothetical protein